MLQAGRACHQDKRQAAVRQEARGWRMSGLGVLNTVHGDFDECLCLMCLIEGRVGGC